MKPPLYPFQKEDIAVLLGQIQQRGFAVSHHEQGLGKSRMSIQIADTLGVGRALILAPAIARISWAEEVEKWSELSRVVVVIKGSKDIAKLAKVGSKKCFVVCTYDLCRNEQVQSTLREFGFGFAILDEVQQLRSASAKRTRAVYDRTAGVLAKIEKIMIMTGTPVVSWPLDLWTHLKRFEGSRIARNGKPMTLDEFKHTYHIVRSMPNPHNARAPRIEKIVNTRNLDDLRSRMKGWAVRRRKVDVVKDLPPMNTRLWRVEGDAKTRRGLIEALREELPPAIMQQLEAADTPAKMEAAMQVVASSSAHVSKVQRLTGMAKAVPIARVLKDELAESTYKLGVFCWNTDVVDVMKNELRDYAPAVITGQTPHTMRASAVSSFMTNDKCRVFVGQIQACGTALTLTSASRCIFAQLSWTPGDNAQAAARFHRIGQRDSVDIRIAYLADSIDEAMNRVLSIKSRSAWNVIDHTEEQD